MSAKTKTPFVRFAKVNKTYDGKEFVVKELDLEVFKGEFVTILGPSGSGKTTCLSLIAGFEDIDLGQIYLNGISVNKLAPHKRNIGMVFQNYALFPHMTVEQNLAFPLKYNNFAKSQRKEQIDKFLKLVELQDFANRYPAQLSGGQKQRVALARVLVYEPSLVLMDEPLAALDKNLRQQMQYEIKKLHEMLGFTVIYVTHNQKEALTMSDRVAVLNQGQIQQIDTPKNIYQHPSNRFVAEFIGENNILKGKLQQIENNIAFIKVNNEIIQACPNNINSSDSEVLVAIRPEKILIIAQEKDADNQFVAKISNIIYVGDHLRIYVNLLDGKSRFIIKQANYLPDNNYSKGDTIKIAWQIKDCLAIKA